MRYRPDDINLLLPSFRAVVQRVLDGMKARGYKPVLFDGLRTLEEAARNAVKGTGIKDSIHCYGAAADVICDDHGWSCAAKGCKFFDDLGAEAEATGSVWGGRFSTRVDKPHFQGIPATRGAENAMRALGRGPESVEKRDALVRQHYAKR